jgi:hypothetical protein
MCERYCWICGDPATTGEHKSKRSDLQALLGEPTQNAPFYYHDSEGPNRPVRSYRADFLKSPSRLCAVCNNQRTQPYDRAWERLSDYLWRWKPPLRPGDIIQTNQVWATDPTKEMSNVQLYFSKLTGCLLAARINFDQSSLAQSLMEGRPSPYIFLKFRASKCCELVGMTNLYSDVPPDGDPCGVAAWMYSLGSLGVEVHYLKTNGRHLSLPDAWHPFSESDRLTITAPLNERAK